MAKSYSEYIAEQIKNADPQTVATYKTAWLRYERLLRRIEAKNPTTISTQDQNALDAEMTRRIVAEKPLRHISDELSRDWHKEL